MKRTIAIVAGGDSSEHDVSLRSAEGILSFMDTEKYDCYVVEMKGTDWKALYKDEVCPIDRNDFSFTAKDGRHTFDFAYITIHGTPGENGILQGYFDLIGMPYSTSDVLVESLTFNKYALNNFLRSNPDLNISESVLLRKDQIDMSDEDIIARVGLPCFVKPNAGGSSFGVTKVKSADALRPAIERAMMESNEVMAEKSWSEQKSPVAAIVAARKWWCSPSRKLSPRKTSSTTTPNTTTSRRKSPQPASLPKQRHACLR